MFSLQGHNSMRSLYLRILLALVGTVVVSLVAFLATFFAMTQPAQVRLIRQFQARRIDDAVATYQRGGKAALSSYLDSLDRTWRGATHYLVDAGDRDVMTGENRSALVTARRGPLGGAPEMDGRLVIVEGRAPYRLVIVAPPPFNVWSFVPYYVLILAAVALVCWLIAFTIVRPVRQLAGAVDRFGSGDLATRIAAPRGDEVGDLARAFNRMAERIETLMTAERRLLQDISHELRSPLARLHLAIELTRTAPDREQALGRIQKEVDRLTTLVETLMEMTRAEGDPATRKSQPVALAALVDDVAHSCELEAQARHCRIVVNGEPGGTVSGDPELLRRAVENILRNAIRYAPSGSDIDVRIGTHNASTEISVRDDGPGVPEDALPRLSQPFFRADDSRDAATGGVGLGLAIAQRAIHLHHGTLSAENAHPGLRVTLTVPSFYKH
jgi:two-component system sensor histidine kinase CpxA